MTIFDKSKSLNIDELVDLIVAFTKYDYYPWEEWWDYNYCDRCEPEFGYLPELNCECEYAWCECHKNCKFFQELDEVPYQDQIIKMWLESECE